MHKPNFFIIGAPKCGTTSLATWLSEHPQVFMSSVKEPHFFSLDLNLGQYKTLTEYEALFRDVHDDAIAIGEASTEYLYSQKAVPEIEKIYPGSRYIIMLRNPVDLAFSFYNYEKTAGRETCSTFEEAWQRSPDRRNGTWVSRWCPEPKWLDYYLVASLGEQVKRLLGHVEARRTLFLLLDDVATHPREEYIRVLDFLGVYHDSRIDFNPKNTARQVRWPALMSMTNHLSATSKSLKTRIGIPASRGTGFLRALRQLNWKKASRSDLPLEVKTRVARYFHNDIRLLSELIGRDLSGWIEEDI